MQNRLTSLTSRLWLRATLFSLAYLGMALLSGEISFKAASFPTFWFPSGLFVAVLLLSEIETWPVYLLAALPASLIYSILSRQPAVDSGLVYFSGVLEALAGAWLIRRFDSRAGRFDSPANVFNLIVFSALVSSVLATTLSTTVLASLHRGVSYWATWRLGLASHGLGILVTAPLILSWARRGAGQIAGRLDAERLIELAILVTGLFVCSLYIFVGNFSLNRQSYMVVPFLVWVALRFGPRGATLSGLIVTLVSAWGTTQQLEGFAINDATIAVDMDVLGSFLAISLVTCYILATVMEQSKRSENALRESEARYRRLIENQGEGMAVFDPEAVFTFANPAAAQIFGADPLINRSLREFTDARNFALIRQQMRQREAARLVGSVEKAEYEAEIIQPGGKRRILHITATPEYDDRRKFTGTFAVFHDITERNQADVALRDSRARFQTLFDHSPIAIWEMDFLRVKRLLDALKKQGVEDFREFFSLHPEQVEACGQLVRVLDVNQAALQLFEYSDKNLFMSEIHKVLNRGPQDLFIEELIAIAENKTEFEREGPNDLIGGVIRYHHVRWTVAPGYEQDYRRVIVTIADVTERLQAEENMRYLSTHDVLTGLYNRNFFEAEMERLQNSRLEPVNVMMVDVNGMKFTNDTYGHAAGDELLRRTAQVLRMSFRKEDIIARIGGDEFVVLFHGTISIQDAINRVMDVLGDHNHWYDGPPLSVAIGASTGGKGSSLVELFKKADQQMYKEKLRTRKTHTETKNG